MILIAKLLTACYVIAYSAVLKAVDEFVRMREFTRSVKVALKWLNAVVLVDFDLPYWTSNVEYLAALRPFLATFYRACAQTATEKLPV